MGVEKNFENGEIKRKIITKKSVKGLTFIN